MSDERRKILDMLSEGKITVDDAERLLKALDGGIYLEDRVQDAVEGGLETLERLGDTLADEVGHGVRKQVTVVVDKEDEASTRDDAFEVGEKPRLEVRSFNGRVRVNAGEPGSIRVRAKLSNPNGVEYAAVQEGDLVRVEAKPRRRSGGFLHGLFGQGSGASIDVTVPVSTGVDLATSNRPVELRGTEEGGTVKTSNARIQIERVRGDLSAQTSNGRIAVETFEGSAELATTNGRVTIDGGQGRFDVETINGRIGFQGGFDPGGRNRLVTSNGRIEVALNAEPSLKVEASTVNGRIDCQVPDFAASKVSGGGLEGLVGRGEAELVAKTVNGSITIR